MTVEIRELVIKTQINANPAPHHPVLDSAELGKLKQQIIAQCLRSLKSHNKTSGFNR
jgi:hypothetical protein